MKRRDLISALGIAGWAGTGRALAQQSGLPVIGFLNPVSPETYTFNVEAFHKGLRSLGFVEGQNVTIEWRWANGDYGRMPALAQELVARKVSVIAATGDIAVARAAQAATASIPVVFTIGSDPVAFGLVTSLHRPGGNLTGMTLSTSTLIAKRVEVLAQLLPQARLFALLINPDNANAEIDIKEAESAARTLGREMFVASARSSSDFRTAFAVIMERRADGALIASDPMMLSQRAALVAEVARHRLPTVYWGTEFVAAGGLVSYGTGITWMYYQAGIYCGRILRGARVSDLPVQRPTKFDVVINLKTARSLNIEIPPPLIALADEIID